MTPGSIRFAGFCWRPLGRRAPVVADLDLVIDPGERVLLVGASGAGKSTLLNALVGALGSTIAGDLSGSAEVSGRVGMLPQDPRDAVVADRIGRDVAFGPENDGLPRDEIWRRVDAALEAVRLPYGRDRKTSALSGGEGQRLVLAGVLALRPDVLLLDEPTSMLDPTTADAVRDAVLDVAGGRTLVVVEHRFDAWLDHVDRVLVLAGGAIVFDGRVADFLASSPVEGVWMPGLPDPVPLDVPAQLVAPESDVVAPRLAGVAVMLGGTSALSGCDLHWQAGIRTALVGPSGSGKSTALAVSGGLLRADAGTVTPNLAKCRSRELARDVGWVPQSAEHGFLSTSVSAEISLTARRIGRSVDVGAVLELLGLSHVADGHPFRLSGGEQRRLAMAAALAHRPGLVLADEPTVGQDRRSWAAVAGWLTCAAQQGATVGVATHDEALPADMVVRLASGRIA